MVRWLALISSAFVWTATLTGVVPGVARAQAETQVTETFAFTGDPQTFTVPGWVTEVEVVACGAQGAGLEEFGLLPGGEGGRVTSVLSVTPGEILLVVVGGEGTGTAGGYNGGGSGGVGTGGGGASDVRQGGSALSDRVVVGAGGGGSGALVPLVPPELPPVGLHGGEGGTSSINRGGGGSSGGGPGLATQGGVGGVGDFGDGEDGSLGVGGDGIAAGGGGGLYGGGGGGSQEVVEPFVYEAREYGGGGGGWSLGDSSEQGVCTGNGYVTITYDDAPLPTVVPGGAAVAEGDSATTTLNLPVTLSAPSDQPVTVGWYTIDTLTQPEAGLDYISASGTVTFDPGVTDATVPITVNGDTLDEGAPASWDAEWGAVRFHSPTNAVLAAGWGQIGFALIVDDDPLPAVDPQHGQVLEGDSGTTSLEVPVSLSAPSGNTVTVEWNTIDTLTQPEAGVDYEPASGTVTFDPGETDATVPVVVYGDTLPEDQLYGAEWGVVSFHSPTNATIGSGWDRLGLALIVDDD